MVECQPSILEITTIIVNYCEREKLRTVVRRTSSTLELNICPSVERKIFDSAHDSEILKKSLIEAGSRELEKANTNLSEKSIVAAFQAELDACDEAIRSKNVLAMLALFPGKQLVPEIFRRTGCSNLTSYMRAINRALKPTDYPSISSLRDRLLVSGKMQRTVEKM